MLFRTLINLRIYLNKHFFDSLQLTLIKLFLIELTGLKWSQSSYNTTLASFVASRALNLASKPISRGILGRMNPG